MEGVEYDKAEKHCDRYKKLWWHLKLPRTPKFHLGKHALSLCKKSKGIGENAEDEGERGHQTGAKNDKRYGAMIDHVKKTNAMHNFEVMEKDPNVRAKQEEMLNLTKRKFTNPRESADDRSAQAREARATKRDALLTDDFEMPTGEMVTLRDRKKTRMLDSVA